MDHSVLLRVIADQHEYIRNLRAIRRPYALDPAANYALTGLRRSGKSTLLYQMAQDLVASGTAWERIVFVNFEDERLAGFTAVDFNDIVALAAQISNEPAYFFLDEPQIIDGWERFARRLADAGEHVYITGSNAKMLSSQIASTLGGRYLNRPVHPLSFAEFLAARDVSRTRQDLLATKPRARIQRAFEEYLHVGGLPEVQRYRFPREYLESVYQKVLLGDIAARNEIRNSQALRLLMMKLAEAVGGEISSSRLRGLLGEVGLRLSTDTVIDYLGYAEEAFLTFHIPNHYTRFAEREGSLKRYFSDNGLLNLLLVDQDPTLLENLVAGCLMQRYKQDLCFLKSAKTGIDVDLAVPSAGLAVQVAYALSDTSRKREIGNLVKLAKADGSTFERLVIVTAAERQTVQADGASIEVIPAAEFLLENGPAS